MTLPTRQANKRTVATVNTLAVDAEEFRMVAQSLRAQVLTDYPPNEQTNDYWNTPVGGTTPAQCLTDRTLAALIRIKLQQQLLVEAGIWEDTSYQSFLQAYGALDAQAGVQTYTAEQYYRVRLDQGLVRLRNEWTDSRLAVSQAEMDQRYRNGKDAFLFLDDGSKKPMDEVKTLLESRLREEKLEALVDHQVKTAKVVRREQVLQNFQFS